jgi:hypothetical protein
VAEVANVNDLLADHVTLEGECLDRLYLSGYVPNLQVSGQVVTFLCEHRGAKIPSPALFNKIGLAFRKAVLEFAEVNDVPLIRFTVGFGVALRPAILTRWLVYTVTRDSATVTATLTLQKRVRTPVDDSGIYQGLRERRQTSTNSRRPDGGRSGI